MYEIFQADVGKFIIGAIIGFMALLIGITFVSVYKNRRRIRFHSLIVRDSGNISKVGVSFILILCLIVYQVVTSTEISVYLVELLGVIFAAELGQRYVESRKISPSQVVDIKNSLNSSECKRVSAPAKVTDDIDFDNL